MAAVTQNYKAKFTIALLPLKIQKIRKLILTDNAPQKEILEIVSKKVTKFKRFFPKNSLNSNNLEIFSKKVTKFKRFFPKTALHSNNLVSLRRSQKIR